jgi:hypothetical protein
MASVAPLKAAEDVPPQPVLPRSLKVLNGLVTAEVKTSQAPDVTTEVTPPMDPKLTFLQQISAQSKAQAAQLLKDLKLEHQECRKRISQLTLKKATNTEVKRFRRLCTRLNVAIDMLEFEPYALEELEEKLGGPLFVAAVEFALSQG